MRDTEPPAIDIEAGWLQQHDVPLSHAAQVELESYISKLTKTAHTLNQVVRLPLDPACIRCPGRGIDYSNLPAAPKEFDEHGDRLPRSCPTCLPFVTYDPPTLLIDKFICSIACGKRYVNEKLAKPEGYAVWEASCEYQGMQTPDTLLLLTLAVDLDGIKHLRTVFLQCERSGSWRKRENNRIPRSGTRASHSKRCSCPWRVNINAPPSLGRVPRITHMVLVHNHLTYEPSEGIRLQVSKASSEQIELAQVMSLEQGMGRTQIIKVPSDSNII